MENKQRFNGTQYRSFPLSECGIRVIDEENRTVELSFSSETPIERWGDYEVLSHKAGAVLLERLNTTGCLLFNHNRDKVIGKIVKARIENRRGIATVQFDDDDESLIYYNKVKNGSLRGVSVGYIVREYTTTKNDQKRTTYTATLWEALEISIVSVPADISVGVGRSMTEGERGYSTKNADYQIMINQNFLNARRKKKK